MAAKQQAMIEELAAFGYPMPWCRLAVEQTGDVDAASEWIMENESMLEATAPDDGEEGGDGAADGSPAGGGGGGVGGVGDDSSDGGDSDSDAGSSSDESGFSVEEARLDGTRESRASKLLEMARDGSLEAHVYVPESVAYSGTEVLRLWFRAAVVASDLPTVESALEWLAAQDLASPAPSVLLCGACSNMWVSVLGGEEEPPEEITDVDDMGLRLTAAAWEHKQYFDRACPVCDSHQCAKCGEQPYHVGLDCGQFATYKESTAEYAKLREQNKGLLDFGAAVEELIFGGGREAVTRDALLRARETYDGEMVALRSAAAKSEAPEWNVHVGDERDGMRDLLLTFFPYGLATVDELIELGSLLENTVSTDGDDGADAAGGAGGAAGGAAAAAGATPLDARGDLPDGLSLREMAGIGEVYRPFVLLRVTLPARYPLSLPVVSVVDSEFVPTRVADAVVQQLDTEVLRPQRGKAVIQSYADEFARRLSDAMAEETKANAGKRRPVQRSSSSRIAQRYLGCHPSEFVRGLELNGTVVEIEDVVRRDLLDAFRRKEDAFAAKYGARGTGRTIAFHGTTATATASIVRTGLRVPGQHGHGHRTDTGYYGAGIYLGAQHYISMGYTERGSEAKLLVCAALMGRTFPCVSLMMGASLEEGFDSHTSPDGGELVLFDSAQVLPLLVITIDCSPFYPGDMDGPVGAGFAAVAPPAKSKVTKYAKHSRKQSKKARKLARKARKAHKFGGGGRQAGRKSKKGKRAK